MPQAPQHKGPVGPVPKACGEKDDELVQIGAGRPLPVAPQGDVQIVPEPGAEGDVPPPPELLDGLGGVGQVEVLQKPEAEQPAQADGHVAVSAEVKVDLQGVAHRPQPGQAEVQLGGRQGEHRVGHLPGGVGQEHLLSQAEDKPAQAGQGQLRGQLPPVDLAGHVVVDDDGTGDELGKEGDVQQQLPRVPGPPLRMAVDVDDVAHPLEGIEGDADGQHDPREGQIRPGQAVNRPDDKVHVLEHAQQRPGWSAAASPAARRR